jgi:hypothetical protein
MKKWHRLKRIRLEIVELDRAIALCVPHAVLVWHQALAKRPVLPEVLAGYFLKQKAFGYSTIVGN